MNSISELAKSISKANKELFIDNFFEIWPENGFGTFSKKDTEILIFALLNELLDKNKPQNNYEWAKLLKLTPTKVKNMQMEAYLKFGGIFKTKDVNEILKNFISSIKKFDLEVTGNSLGLNSGTIKILAENPIIKFELDNIAKKFGGMINFERNQEILIIGLTDFLKLSNIITQSGEEKIIDRITEMTVDDSSKLDKIKREVQGRAYANKSEADKLITFLELLGETFASKPMKLISHLKTIIRSQKYH